MTYLFSVIFYEPILNLLIFLYKTIALQDFGLAIILLTLAIKLILWPLNQSAIKSQKELQDLQPKIDELKKKYATDKMALSQATMALYKDNKTNPFSSCLPLLIQLPVLIAVYSVFRNVANNNLDKVYSFVGKPEFINTISFGFLNLGKPNVYLAVLAGLAQFWQAKMMIVNKPAIKSPGSNDESMAAIMNKQMLYFMPLVTVFIGISLPGGLTLYWFVLTIFTALQQLYVLRKSNSSEKNNQALEGEIIK